MKITLPLVIAAFAFLSACVVVVYDEDVRNAQGSGFDYSARFNWNSLRIVRIEAEAGRDGRPDIIYAEAVVFEDRNGNRSVDQDEVIHRFQTEDGNFDVHRVEWGPLKLDHDLDQVSIWFLVEANDRTVSNLLDFDVPN